MNRMNVHSWCPSQSQVSFLSANRISNPNEIRKMNLNILFQLNGLVNMGLEKLNHRSTALSVFL